jgi:pyridoxal phosphate enzyme (YggS family)
MRDTVLELETNLRRVRDRIATACREAGRRPESVTLVAVTKNAAPEQVRALIGLGVSDLGENYAQPLAQRAAQFGEFHARRVAAGDPAVARELRWHMIGHLQRNKSKHLLPHLAMLQTLDSLRLAEELDEMCGKAGKRLPCLVQVNASEESQKSGVAVGAAVHLAEQVATMPNLRLMGVMCMAEEGVPQSEARKTFARCAEIFEEMRHNRIAGDDMRHLSMGMTQDLEAGILEGATIVRVGSALFGSPGVEPGGSGTE